jgi:hypothetical protein
MITAVKNMLWRMFPGLQVRLRRRFRQYPRITDRVGSALDWRVGSGPFAGMRYIQSAAGSRLVPKLVGSYELELHEWIEQLAKSGFRQVLVNGCAEGYYAVGLARRMPSAKVFAFDLEPRAQALCAELARLNDVSDRIEIQAGASPEVLAPLDLANTLIVCDCEGYEKELLDPIRVPQLCECTILLELHDCFVPGVTEALRNRFSQTHSVEIRPMQPRDPTRYPSLNCLSPRDRAAALDEDRTQNGRALEMSWALLQPKAGGR